MTLCRRLTFKLLCWPKWWPQELPYKLKGVDLSFCTRTCSLSPRTDASGRPCQQLPRVFMCCRQRHVAVQGRRNGCVFAHDRRSEKTNVLTREEIRGSVNADSKATGKIMEVYIATSLCEICQQEAWTATGKGSELIPQTKLESRWHWYGVWER